MNSIWKEYTWKEYKSTDGLRRAWYDRHLRMWTMQNVDGSGNQLGECDYSTDRGMVFRWVKSGVFKKDNKP